MQGNAASPAQSRPPSQSLNSTTAPPCPDPKGPPTTSPRSLGVGYRPLDDGEHHHLRPECPAMQGNAASPTQSRPPSQSLDSATAPPCPAPQGPPTSPRSLGVVYRPLDGGEHHYLRPGSATPPPQLVGSPPHLNHNHEFLTLPHHQ